MTASSTDPQPDDRTATDGLASFWERHYRRRRPTTAVRPNPLLVDVAGPLPAGTALDLGCGEGGNALWLAGRGWQVTAVDVSAAALALVARHAADGGVAERITLGRQDLTDGLPAGTYDLVSAQYLQSPVAFDRDRVLRAAASAVAVGGLLLVVDHASVAPWSWADPDTRFPTADDLLASLRLPDDEWRYERVGAVSRTATGPGGQTATVIENVVAVRRLTR